MTEAEVSQAAPEVAAPAKKKFNRKDYIIEKKIGETIVKVPGTINGKAFAIRYLENCTIHLFDHSAQVSNALLPTPHSSSSCTCFRRLVVTQSLTNSHTPTL